MECCQNSNIKLINGIWTYINCVIVHGPQIIHGWISYKQCNVISYKTVYSRTAYISCKLRKLQLTSNEINAFMEVWSILESRLKTIYSKRFPKVDFFIDKILEGLDISKKPSYKISSELREKYNIMYFNLFHNFY